MNKKPILLPTKMQKNCETIKFGNNLRTQTKINIHKRRMENVFKNEKMMMLTHMDQCDCERMLQSPNHSQYGTIGLPIFCWKYGGREQKC